MLDKQIARINAAVDECLERCTKANNPRIELDAFMREEEQAASLKPEELRAVETIVFRILQDREQRGGKP